MGGIGVGRVRGDDVKLLLRLVGECNEVHSPMDRRQHFLHGLARITRSSVALEGVFVVTTSSLEPRDMQDVGWSSPTERDHLYSYYTAGNPPASDRLNKSVMERLAVEPVATLARRDVMSPGEWDRTELRHEVHRPLGLDDAIVSLTRQREAHEFHGVVVKRAWREPGYVEEDRNIVHLAHSECAWLFPPTTAGATTPTGEGFDHDLTCREREILALLLTGAPEKHVAATVSLSRHTVHGYIKGIYKKAGVSRRAELMALAIARGPRGGEARPTAPAAGAKK
jgi:DNA-binding CsgD family transcriptional regulator